MGATAKALVAKVVTRPRSDVTTIEDALMELDFYDVVTRPRSDVTTIKCTGI